MVSEAQRRAAAKYQKERVKQVTVKFTPVDADLYEYLSAQESKAGYLKSLIRADMEGRVIKE